MSADGNKSMKNYPACKELMGCYLYMHGPAHNILVLIAYMCVNSLPPGKFFPAFLSSADFFQNQLFKKNSFTNTTRVSKSLYPDQPDIVSELFSLSPSGVC